VGGGSGRSSLVSLFQFSSPLFPQSTSVSGFVGEEAGEEEGGCLYMSKASSENCLAEICCVEGDTETHKQRRGVGGGGGATELQNLVVKREVWKSAEFFVASFDVLMMVLFRGCNLREFGERKVVNWFVVSSKAWL
jgi:hypothetical protein